MPYVRRSELTHDKSCEEFCSRRDHPQPSVLAFGEWLLATFAYKSLTPAPETWGLYLFICALRRVFALHATAVWKQ